MQNEIKRLGEKMPAIADSCTLTQCFISGDVRLGENVSVWPFASLRGDCNSITIGQSSNVQDNVSVHVSEKFPVQIGMNVTIGHNATVHGATIGDDTLIGMGAVVLDGAVIGKGCIIGAGALIPPGKIIPDRSLVVGNPYRIVRETSDADVQANRDNAQMYEKLAKAYKI